MVTALYASELIHGAVAAPLVRALLVKRARIPGTDANDNSAGTQAGGFSLAPDDYAGALGSHDAQPKLPEPATEPEDRCEYAYKSVLGAHNATSLGEVWALPGFVDLVAGDVQQGAIGDCALGASVMALVSGGHTKYVRNSLQFLPDRPNPGDRYIITFFKEVVQEGGERKVKTNFARLDDQLPTLTNSNDNCFEYLGYQPVKDAALQAADGSYPSTNIFFMPLFEKAWAKYMDARPDFRSSSTVDAGYTGYLGVEATPGRFALEAFTGGNPISVVRTKPGWEDKILIATFKCLREEVPCVIGTPNAVTLDRIREKDQYGAISYPGAVVGSDSGNNNHTFTLIDHDNGEAVRTLVGTHAYAIDRRNSVVNKKIEESRVRLLNPWGCNPDILKEKSGSCPSGDREQDITLSLRAFLGIVNTIQTVENMEKL